MEERIISLAECDVDKDILAHYAPAILTAVAGSLQMKTPPFPAESDDLRMLHEGAVMGYEQAVADMKAQLGKEER